MHFQAKHKTPAGKFPTMFQPSTKFSFNNIIQHGGNYPDMSPEAKIADEDTKNLITLAKRVLNGTLDYLIINVFGAGANLPVSSIFEEDVLQFRAANLRLPGLLYLHAQPCVHCVGPSFVRAFYELFRFNYAVFSDTSETFCTELKPLLLAFCQSLKLPSMCVLLSPFIL